MKTVFTRNSIFVTVCTAGKKNCDLFLAFLVSLKLNYKSSHLHGALALLLVTFCSGRTWSQQPVLNNYVSPTPNAAGLAEYVETPVGDNTGIPNIGIPLYTIKSRTLNWPIGLSYHGAGIKVSEVGGIVGLGWSLQASGIVSRIMRGLPDEANDAYFEFASSIPDETDIISTTLKQQLADGEVDMLPDFFYYNIGVDGGRILFDNQLEPRTIPRNDAKISVNDIETLDSFTIVQPDGTIFQFEDSETSSTYLLGPDPPSFKSTWYLTRIVSADRSDTIKFNYTSYSYQYSTNEQAALKFYYSVPGGASKNNNTIEVETHTSLTTVSNAKALSSIVFHGGKLEFTSSNRTDDTSKKLDAIIIYYKDPLSGDYVEGKRINFGYSYFQNSGGEGVGTRLRLDSLQEQASGSYMPPYKFIYSTKQLPSKDSYALDHWGYFNGATGNDGLIPERQIGGYQFAFNNREVNSSVTDACILNKIISPLEGETEYIFEPNEYLDGTTNTAGPGLRIKKIIKRDPFSAINAITNYEYKRPSDGLSSGKLVDDPQYDASMPVSDLNGGIIHNYNCLYMYAQPMGIGNFSDSPVLYEYVTIYQGDAFTVAGKTISKFSVYDPAYAGYPYVPEEDNSWAAGRLISQERYKVVGSTETIVSKTVNTFDLSSQTAMVKGLKVGLNKILINQTPTTNDFDVQNYFTYSKFQYLKESRTYTYEENSSALYSEQVKNYFIDPELDHTMPVKVTTQTSDSDVIVQEEISYPADYSTGVYAVMNNLNMIALPAESKTFSIQGSNEYLMQFSKTDFLEYGTNKVYPQYTYRPKTPGFTLRSNFNSNPSGYIQRTLTVNQYSEAGVPLEVLPEAGQPAATIVDSYHHRVIASCSPAQYNQVACTGFETPYHGQWTVNQGSSQETGNVNLSLSNASSAFEIQASQTINYAYSVTRTAGPSPILTFSKPGSSDINHTLSAPSGSSGVSLTPGNWTASIWWDTNVTAMSVSFSYQYTYYAPLALSSDAKTGLKSLTLENGHIVLKANLPAANYTISYYQKDGTVTLSVTGGAQVVGTETSAAESDGWQLIRKTVSIANTSDAIELSSSGCKVDEVRLQPEGSFMNTTSYDPRGRMITQTDQNMRSRYVEYDIWSRVKLLRDHEHNIIQHYEYKMAGN